MLKFNYFKFLFVFLFLPQFLLRIPVISEILSTVDLIGCFIIFSLFVNFVNGNKINTISFYFILFFLYLVFSFVLSFLWSPSIDFHLNSALYLIRNLFIFAVIFANYKKLSKLISINDLNMLIKYSIIFNILIIAAYFFGSDLFNSSHTWTTIDQTTINRLGGLPNETGAYGFNCLILSFFYIMLNVDPSRNRFSNFLSLFLISIFLFYSYVFSLARIILLGHFIFLFLLVFHANIFGFIGRLIFLLGLLIVSSTVIFIFLNSNIESEFLIRLVGSQMLDDPTSSRLSHWESAVNGWLESIYSILFGYGFRTTKFTLGMPIENFFITNLFEIGIVGLIVEVLFFRALLIHLFKINSKNLLFSFQIKCLKYTWLVVFIISQLNDVLTYFQSLPLLIFFTLLFYQYDITNSLRNMVIVPYNQRSEK